MEKFDRKKHWENIYQTKLINEVSWFQPKPEISLDFIRQFNVSTTAKIIDVGGGDSFFVDYLLDLGFKDITVLDISEKALDRAKQRLGDRATKVKWLVADAATFKPTEKYDFWHDRATFHFLTQEKEISNYLDTANKSIKRNGIILIGTFSENGPKKCSGIEVRQYSETTMTKRLKLFFEKIKCITIDHITPSGSIQNFIFCCFRKLGIN
jgi:ubiquinone/menaquinone biosynthesis C-methylase UbiE